MSMFSDAQKLAYINKYPYSTRSNQQLSDYNAIRNRQLAYQQSVTKLKQQKQLRMDWIKEEQRIKAREKMQAMRVRNQSAAWRVRTYNSPTSMNSRNRRIARASNQQSNFRKNFNAWPNSQINKRQPRKLHSNYVAYRRALSEFNPLTVGK